MEKIRTFNPIDRYAFDFNICSIDKGFAQIDTEQDAHYFGNWGNPFTLKLFSYTEGDIVETVCDNEQEFIDQMERINSWNIEQGFKPVKVDPGFNTGLKEQFIKLGLEHFLH